MRERNGPGTASKEVHQLVGERVGDRRGEIHRPLQASRVGDLARGEVEESDFENDLVAGPGEAPVEQELRTDGAPALTGERRVSGSDDHQPRVLLRDEPDHCGLVEVLAQRGQQGRGGCRVGPGAGGERRQRDHHPGQARAGDLEVDLLLRGRRQGQHDDKGEGAGTSRVRASLAELQVQRQRRAAKALGQRRQRSGSIHRPQGGPVEGGRATLLLEAGLHQAAGPVDDAANATAGVRRGRRPEPVALDDRQHAVEVVGEGEGSSPPPLLPTPSAIPPADVAVCPGVPGPPGWPRACLGAREGPGGRRSWPAGGAAAAAPRPSWPAPWPAGRPPSAGPGRRRPCLRWPAGETGAAESRTWTVGSTSVRCRCEGARNSVAATARWRAKAASDCPAPGQIEVRPALQLLAHRIVHRVSGGTVTIPTSSTPMRFNVASTSMTKP